MNITKENLVSALFIDNERKNIECLIKDNTQVISHIVAYDEKHPDFIDKIHNDTQRNIKLQSELNKKMYMSILEKTHSHLKNEITEDFYKLSVDFYISFDKDKNNDKLFNFKLYLFELDFVKNSNDQELKAKLRKSLTPFEALQIAIEIKNKV
jgi:hypothetical protein